VSRHGLAYEQAPPFGVPLLFMLVAPAFLFAAGVLAMFPHWTAGLLAPRTVALTHLLTLGFLGLVMLGALTQMLPVVGGVPVPGAVWVGRIAWAGLTLGTPLLAWAMDAMHTGALRLAAGWIALTLCPYLAAGALALARARSIDTVRGMRLAVAALPVVVLLGLGLVAWLRGDWQPADPLRWLERHALAGLAGWIGMLVVATAWQVVPMLQVTPPYPPRLTRALAWGLGVSLAWALLAPSPWQRIGHAGIGVGLIAFALVTLDVLRRRRRKTPDVTLDYWRVAMTCLIAACLLFLTGGPNTPRLLAGVLFLLGFAVSVTHGMLGKIVPFLAWFHLQSRRNGRGAGLPTMKDFLPDCAARRQFRLHVAALACLAGAPFLPALAIPGGALLAASAFVLALNLVRAARLYLSHGGGF
jgi:hypothetical protein